MTAVLVTVAFAFAVPGAFLLGFALRPWVDRALGDLFRWGWW